MPDKGLPADHPDSFEARYPAKAENLTIKRPGEGAALSEEIIGGYGDDRMGDSSAKEDPTPAPEPVQVEPRVVARKRRKLFRVSMQMDSGTFTTPVADIRVSEYGVMLSVPDTDDLAMFVPAPGTALKLLAPGKEPIPCYFPGTYFQGNGDEHDHTLVFIRGEGV